MSGFAERFDAGVAQTSSTPVVESFESFYSREYRPVLALARVLTGNLAQAEDLAQEAFIAAYRSWSGIHNPTGWIRSAVSNKAMSWWRRSYAANRALARLNAREPAESAMPEDTTAFWAEVRSLPKRQAQALALFYLEDRSVKDIAGILGCDASTVRIHMSRGRRKLAERLEMTT